MTVCRLSQESHPLDWERKSERVCVEVNVKRERRERERREEEKEKDMLGRCCHHQSDLEETTIV